MTKLKITYQINMISNYQTIIGTSLGGMEKSIRISTFFCDAIIMYTGSTVLLNHIRHFYVYSKDNFN